MQKKNFKKIIGSDPKSGVSFPSFKEVARTFNLDYVRLKNSSINKDLTKILSSSKSMIVEVNMNPYQELIPRLQNKLNKDGAFSVPEYDDLYPYLKEDVLEFERKRAKKI